MLSHIRELFRKPRNRDKDLLDWIERSPNPRLRIVTHEWTDDAITFRQAVESAKVKFPNAGIDSSEDLPQKQPMGRDEMLDLLHRCQNGEATCMFTLNKIEEHVDAVLNSYLVKS